MILQMTEVGPLVMQLYDRTEYVYPVGAKAVGWCLALSSVMMVPIIAIKTLCQLPGGLCQVRWVTWVNIFNLIQKVGCLN